MSIQSFLVLPFFSLLTTLSLPSLVSAEDSSSTLGMSCGARAIAACEKERKNGKKKLRACIKLMKDACRTDDDDKRCDELNKEYTEALKDLTKMCSGAFGSSGARCADQIDECQNSADDFEGYTSENAFNVTQASEFARRCPRLTKDDYDKQVKNLDERLKDQREAFKDSEKDKNEAKKGIADAISNSGRETFENAEQIDTLLSNARKADLDLELSTIQKRKRYFLEANNTRSKVRALRVRYRSVKSSIARKIAERTERLLGLINTCRTQLYELQSRASQEWSARSSEGTQGDFSSVKKKKKSFLSLRVLRPYRRCIRDAKRARPSIMKAYNADIQELRTELDQINGEIGDAEADLERLGRFLDEEVANDKRRTANDLVEYNNRINILKQRQKQIQEDLAQQRQVLQDQIRSADNQGRMAQAQLFSIGISPPSQSQATNTAGEAIAAAAVAENRHSSYTNACCKKGSTHSGCKSAKSNSMMKEFSGSR